MKTKIRYAAYSLLGSSLVLTLLLAYPEVNRSIAKAPVRLAAVDMGAESLDEDITTTSTFTATAEGVRTFEHSQSYSTCKEFLPFPAQDDPAPGTNHVGYINHWSEGGIFSCTTQFNDAFRGTVWFDLNEIFSKPAFPKATKATLTFRKLLSVANDNNGKPAPRICEDVLEAAAEDWLTTSDAKTAIASREVASGEFDFSNELKESCTPTGCSIDVTAVVNSWITHPELRFGFVIKGEDENFLEKLIPKTNDACQTRYGDFTLTVTYRYPKPTAPPTPTPIPITKSGSGIPGGDTIALACKNYALGAMVTAKNFTKDGVIPGLHFDPSYAVDGIRHSTADGGNYWRDEHGLPTWLQIEFKDPSTTIDEITVITLQDPGYDKATDPTDTQTFASSGVTAFDVKYFDGGGWVNVPGGSIKSNDRVVTKISFAPITTSMIRVVVNDAAFDKVKIARIVEVEACGHPSAPPKKPDGSGGATGLSARTETAFGLITTMFDTLHGTVSVNLPDDVAAGDTISGTVITEPKGNTRDEQAKNEDSLKGYVVEVAKQETPTQQKEGSKWVIPPVAQFIPVVLKNREGKVVARAEVPVGTVVKPKPNGDQGNYSTPPFGQAGRPISVAGPFDGDFNNTAVNLGNNTAQFLAESPRKVVVKSPANLIGPSTIEVNEQNRFVARCHYQSIGVKLTAGKLNLIRGEQTTVTVTLSGLDGATGPVPMQLTNASPATVRMEGGDTQTIIAQPGEFTGGVFTAKRTLTGIKPGGFAINAVVNPSTGTKSAGGGVWKTCGRGAPGPENSNNLLGFYSEQNDLQNCRGSESLTITFASSSSAIGSNSPDGAKPAGEGLAPGECSWKDRGMHAEESHRITQYVEDRESLKPGGTLAPENRWYEELHSPDKYWIFMVYSQGRRQFAVTGARPKG